jgi:methylthioribose-1-phosphate isomerase
VTSTAPLRFDDGALLVLDQRRLPGEQSWLRCERPEEVAEAILRLVVAGAPQVPRLAVAL